MVGKRKEGGASTSYYKVPVVSLGSPTLFTAFYTCDEG
jgi:hypothetical protein